LLNVILPDTLPGQYIIQLLTERDAVVRQEVINESRVIPFAYLMPGNYKIKAIYDANANGKWDTGLYRKRILPEKVVYYSLPIAIRANWDLQEDWQME